MTTIGFDVDGTLIDYEGNPRYEVIDIYRIFQRLGCRMVIASGGGKDYAECVARRLGLRADLIADKRGVEQTDIFFDDMDVGLGKINIKV